jgi:murein DD-endopeptidase MepM/ murein hydrolase activator NlpD
MKTWAKWTLVACAGSSIALVVFNTDLSPHVEYVPDPPAIAEDTVPAPPSAYDIPLSGFELERGKVKAGSTFGDLLMAHGVSAQAIDSLVKMAGPMFDVRKMRAGHPYAFVFANDTSREAHWFVYEADQVEHVVFGLHPLSVRVGHRSIHTTETSVTCTVNGALYNDLSATGADPMLAMKLSEILAWTVDFYRIQKGDRFTVVYNERSVDGERYGEPEVLAVRYESGGVVKNGYRLPLDSIHGEYYDDEGNSLRKAFLQAPLKFSRISSGFTQRRFHPVQKRFKAHLGTDYAAPYGTPILTVGDGVVEKTGWTAGNGNYVKIRHNGVYETQYLHMRKILVRQGQRVSQGDVIGEVGSTGLATGPHVCFRFWKNGEQVDHRREELPSADPVPAVEKTRFDSLRMELMRQLDNAGSPTVSAVKARPARF